MTTFAIRIFGLAVLTVAFANCADVRREYHYFDDMHYSPAGDTAKLDKYNKRPYDMLEPENTIAYNGAPAYPYLADLTSADQAARELKVPGTFDMKRGEKKYQIYCAPCHGAQGYADGPVARKFASVRPLATSPGKPAQAEGYSLAKIYHIATVGNGAMKGYAPQVQSDDRWNIAAYVKNELQKRK